MRRWSQWLWAAFGCLLMVAYWPGISGVATTPRWDVAGVLAIVLFVGPRARMTAVHYLGLTLLGWLALTLSWETGDARLDGVNELLQLALIAIAFAVASNVRDIRPFLTGCAIGIGINSAVIIAQVVNYPPHLFSNCVDINSAIDTSRVICMYFGNPAGLFYNQDRLAAAAAMIVVGAIADKKLWWSLPLIAPSLILVHSSAAWLAVAIGAFILAGQLPRWLSRTIRLAMIAAGCLAVAVKFGTNSTDERVAIWRDTLPNLNFWGNGLGSFREGFLAHAKSYDFARFQSRPEHPHNEGLWLAYEGGAIASVLAYAFIGALLNQAKGRRGHLAILAAFGVLAMFAMPFHDPATAILAAVVAGHCAGDRARIAVVTLDGGMELRESLAADDHQRVDAAPRHRAFRVPVPAEVS